MYVVVRLTLGLYTVFGEDDKVRKMNVMNVNALDVIGLPNTCQSMELMEVRRVDRHLHLFSHLTNKNSSVG